MSLFSHSRALSSYCRSHLSYSRADGTSRITLSSGQRWETLSLWKRMHRGVSYGTNPWAGCRSSGRIAEMRPGLLVSGRPFLPFVSVHRYPHWQSYRSEPVVAKHSLLMLWVITSPPVPPTRVPRRLMTGRLIRLLMTFFAQPTRLNLNRAVALTLIFMGIYITRMT